MANETDKFSIFKFDEDCDALKVKFRDSLQQKEIVLIDFAKELEVFTAVYENSGTMMEKATAVREHMKRMGNLIDGKK